MKDFVAFTHFVLPHICDFVAFHMGGNHRKWEFRSYTRKISVFTKMAKKLVGERQKQDVLLGWGDHKAESGKKLGYRRAPIEAFVEVLQRFCVLVKLDEYRSTQVSWCTFVCRLFVTYIDVCAMTGLFTLLWKVGGAFGVLSFQE